MKIVFATGIYPPEVGGPATYTRTMAREFALREHDVHVVTYGDDTTEQGNGFSVHVVSRRGGRFLRYVRYAKMIYRVSIDAEIVYAQDPVSVGLPTAIAAMFLRKKFYLKVVGDYAWEQSGARELLDEFLRRRYGIRVELMRSIERWVARRAYRVVVPSAYLKRVVMKWGVSSDTIVVVENGVAHEPLPQKEQARRDLGLEGFVVVSAGRFVAWKGFEALLEALKPLSEVFAVLIGDGPLWRGIKAHYGGQKAVRMTGSVDQGMLRKYLAAADVFILNTGYEGFSHQIIEAMAAGVPVLTTAEGGNAEIVKHGENAMVFPYNDIEAIRELVLAMKQDRALCATIGENGRRSVAMYTVGVMVDKTLGVFSSS